MFTSEHIQELNKNRYDFNQIYHPEKNKKIYDPIHGYIEITPLMARIIDTPEFQRLRDIKQLGATHYVFPSATHTRFEHSIGVSHLAKLMCEAIIKNYSDLAYSYKRNFLLTTRDIELYRIAGLIHDIGHGPYSHLYDDYIIDEGDPHHEERGVIIFKHMVAKYKLPLTKKEVDDIIQFVEPSVHYKRNWKYQIIANKLNGIDVDKLDYIQRDCYHLGLKCGGEFSRIISMVKIKEIHNTKELVLAWPEKLKYEIYSMFSARYRLHKQIYNHHAVKSHEMVIIDILNKIKEGYKGTSCEDTGGCMDGVELSKSMKQFLLLTDSAVHCKIHVNYEEQNLLDTRKQMKLIGEITVCKSKDKKVIENKMQEYVNLIEQSLMDAKLIRKCDLQKINFYTQSTLIGFSSGENNENPLNNVYYYYPENLFTTNTTHSKYCYPSDTEGSSSFMIPKEFQEYIYRVYVNLNNFNDDVERVKKIIDTCKIHWFKLNKHID